MLRGILWFSTFISMLPAAFSPILGTKIYGSQIIQVKYGRSGTSARAYFHLVTVFLIWKCHIFYFLSDTRTFKSKWSSVVMCVTSVQKKESIFIHIASSWNEWSSDALWSGRISFCPADSDDLMSELTPADRHQQPRSRQTHTRMSSDHNDCSACHFSPWGSCAHAATGRGHDSFVVGVYCSFTEPFPPLLYSHKAFDLGLL